jgi:hypothetical protein
MFFHAKFEGLSPPEPTTFAWRTASHLFQSEMARIRGLMAKTNECATRLELFHERGTNLIRLEPVIEGLERDKALKADMLSKVSIETYALKIQGAAEKYRGANIVLLQSPSPPASESKQSYKVESSLAAGGVALGFGLALLSEIVRWLRRPRGVA